MSTIRTSPARLAPLARRIARASASRATAARSKVRDAGQTTAEYGLVILAAGTLALAVILWARNSGSITGLFDTVIDHLTGSLD